MNQTIAQLLYLALIIIILLDSGHAIKRRKKKKMQTTTIRPRSMSKVPITTQSPQTFGSFFYWTAGKMVTLSKLKKNLIVNRTDAKNLAIVELREPSSWNDHLETFTIVLQNQTFKMRNDYGVVLYDLMKNVTSLERNNGEWLRVSGRYAHDVLMWLNSALLCAYYESRVISCTANSVDVWYEKRDLVLRMGVMTISYRYFAKIVQIYDLKRSITIDLARRSIKVARDQKMLNKTWISNDDKILFGDDSVIIVYNGFFLFINFSHKAYKLVLRAVRLSLDGTLTEVQLNCAGGELTMTLRNDETIDSIALIGKRMNGDFLTRINLYNNKTVIEEIGNRVIIENASEKSKKLSLITQNANLIVSPYI